MVRTILIACLLWLFLVVAAGAEASPQFVTQWGGTGTGQGEFNGTRGIAIDSAGNVYVVDQDNHRVQKFTSAGTFLLEWGTEGTGPGQFQWPIGIAVDLNDSVYVSEIGGDRIQKFTNTGTFLRSFGSDGCGPGQFDAPLFIAVDDSNYVYVTDRCKGGCAGYKVHKFASDGTSVLTWDVLGECFEFTCPCVAGIAVDSEKQAVYVAVSGATEFHNNAIHEYTTSGTFVQAWGPVGSGPGELVVPEGLALSTNGFIYAMDYYDDSAALFTGNGEFILEWGEYGTAPGDFDYPYGVAVHPNGRIYITQSGSNLIQVFESATTSVPDTDQGIRIAVAQPNPMSASTRIGFDLVEDGQVRIAVYDLAGRRVRTLIDEIYPAGWHEAVWHGHDNQGRRVPTGIYFYRVEGAEQELGGKILVLN